MFTTMSSTRTYYPHQPDLPLKPAQENQKPKAEPKSQGFTAITKGDAAKIFGHIFRTYKYSSTSRQSSKPLLQGSLDHVNRPPRLPAQVRNRRHDSTTSTTPTWTSISFPGVMISTSVRLLGIPSPAHLPAQAGAARPAEYSSWSHRQQRNWRKYHEP